MNFKNPVPGTILYLFFEYYFGLQSYLFRGVSRWAQINQAILQNVNCAQTLTPIAYCLLPIALSQLLFSMPTYLHGLIEFLFSQGVIP